ncbi:META domain-containing protein [Brumimicrobium glaciale]|uniref:META domain-containing protein n=1 Tax=Brumimicrobium glaciale TaxID=200475 RepID=A0A4Q4KQA4_9FLAO|nr:META domain-containing protein [Brumimicrobium glaciale]RYM35700.1 META domain-containing protein [Brumimicrobium glaciale]
MKLRSVLPFVAGLVILQSCSTPKNEVMWVGGMKTECDAEAGKTECLNVYEGEELKDEKWQGMSADIEGFSFEEGFMKKIEVKKEEAKGNETSPKYTLVKELERKEDPRMHLNGQWVLASINGKNINKMIVLPTMKFDLKAKLISGNGGCNLYSAQIDELSTQNIKLSKNAGTLMECANENMENEYHTVLSEIAKYEVKNEKLTFHNKDGKETMTFIKVDPSQPNPALGGMWMSTRLMGDTIIKADNNPNITFDLDKMMVAGKDGCNNYNASIETLSNADLIIGQIASTKMMCPNMDMADKFTELIAKVVTYKVVGSELIMMDQDGNEVLAFVK